MVRRPIIENCFFGSKDYDGSDKRNAAQVLDPDCTGKISAMVRYINGECTRMSHCTRCNATRSH